MNEYYRVYRYAFEVVNSPLVTVDSGGGVSEADSEDEAEAVHCVWVLTQSNNFCDHLLTGEGGRTREDRTRTCDRLIAIQFHCISSLSSRAAAVLTSRNVPAEVKKASWRVSRASCVWVALTSKEYTCDIVRKEDLIT